jgi:hypothetical protein
MQELKPCPFCGGEAEFIEGYYDKPLYSVECKNKSCGGMVLDMDDCFDEDLIKTRWNKRVQ